MASRKRSKLVDYLKDNYTEFDSVNSERIKALYADFSKLSVLNKYAYDTNISFWKKIILDCSQQGGILCSFNYSLAIEQNTLAEKFVRPIIGKPISLDLVIDTMKKNQQLISLKDFYEKYMVSTTSWYSWIRDKVINNWKSTEEHEFNPSVYIILPTLQSIIQAILNDVYHKSPESDYIMTLHKFKSKYAYRFHNQIELTDQDIDLVLTYLHSQHGVGLAENIQGYGTYYRVIKFPQQENTIAVIDQHDKAVISIRTTCDALFYQVEELQKKSEQLLKEANNEKNKGHITKEQYYLKRKKSLQEILEKRLNSMEIMDTLLMKIESSKDDIQVIQAFNLGANTLKSLIQIDGLDSSSIDDVMEKVQIALEDQKEIEDVIKSNNTFNTVEEDSELEIELSKLLNEDHIDDKSIYKNQVSNPKSTQDYNNSELARLSQIFSPSTKKKKELAS